MTPTTILCLVVAAALYGLVLGYMLGARRGRDYVMGFDEGYAVGYKRAIRESVSPALVEHVSARAKEAARRQREAPLAGRGH